MQELEPRNPPPTRQTVRTNLPDDNQQQPRADVAERTKRGLGGSRRPNLDESLEDIEEEVSTEFVEASEGVALVIQDHMTRAAQRKEEFTQRSSDAQKRVADLAASRLRKELMKADIR